MGAKARPAHDEAGRNVLVFEVESLIDEGTLEEPGAGSKGMSSWYGPENESLNMGADGWLVGVHSKKRYKLK